MPRSCCLPDLDTDDRRVSRMLSLLLCSSCLTSYAGACEAPVSSKAAFCCSLPLSLIRFSDCSGMLPRESGPSRMEIESALARDGAMYDCSFEHEHESHCEAGHFGGCGQIRCFLRKQRDDASQFARRRHPVDDWDGDLSQLHTGWPLCVATENTTDELLHLRLPVLNQPPVEQRAARTVQAGRGRSDHARFLPAQLH